MRRLMAFAVSAALLLPGFAYSDGALTTLAAKKTVTLMGYSRRHKAIDVSAEVSGKVLRVNYEVGDVIGDAPFVEVDPTFVDFEIEEARNAMEGLEVSLAMSESRVAYLDKEFRRIDALHRGDRATEVSRDAAAQELRQARLERDSIVVRMGSLRTKLAELRERRARHSVRLPRGWVLTARAVEAGEVVRPCEPLGRASDFRRLVVPLSVSPEELAAIRAMRGEFDASLGSEPVRARLNWVNPEFDEKTRKQGIEILITSYAGPRTGGLRFTLPLRVRAGGVLVPKAAVLSRYENPRVTVAATGEVVRILVIGDSADYVVAAEDERIAPGTALARPAE